MPGPDDADDADFAAMRSAYHAAGGFARGDDLARVLEDFGRGSLASLARRSSPARCSASSGGTAVVDPDVPVHRGPALKPGLKAVLAELSSEYDGRRLAEWFVEPNGWLEEARPIDVLDSNPDGSAAGGARRPLRRHRLTPRPRSGRAKRAQSVVPNSEPMPAVRAIARALQNVTRQAPVEHAGAADVRGDAPSAARKASDMPEIQNIRPDRGATAATASGSRAPAAKLAAEASAAWIGRARQGLRDAELVARMRAEGVVRGQLLGHLVRQSGSRPRRT